MANRVFGLSGSGMDIDQMVKDMMKARRTRYDTLYKKMTQLQWKKAEYNTMYTAVSDFRNTVFSNKLQANLSPRKTSSTNTSAVTASAGADAANMTHNLEVTKLANGVQEASSDKITTGSAKDTLINQFGMTAGNFMLQITNGNTTASVNVDTTQSIYDVVSNINKAGIGVVANYDANIDRFFLSTSASGANAGIDFSGSSAMGLDFLTNKLKLIKEPTISGSATSSAPVDVSLSALSGGTFTGGTLQLKNGLNTVDVAISASDSIANLINKINGSAGVNGVAALDASGNFSIKSTSGVLDLSGSDAAVMSLLTGGLKLPNGSDQLKAITSAGVTSTAPLDTASATDPISSVFSNIAGKSTLNINGTSVTIDFSKATMTTIIDSINNSGTGVTASYDAFTRKFIVSGASVDLSASDSMVKNFLTNNLKLDSSLTGASLSSSDALFADPATTSLASQFGLVAGGVYNFRVTNGTNINNISLNTSTDTLKTFIDKLNGAGMNATASYNYTTRKFTISTGSGTLDFTGSDSAAMTFLSSKLKLTNLSSIDSTGSTSSAAMFTSEADKSVTSQFSGITGGRFNLVINGQTVAVDTDSDNLDTLVTNINNAGAGATASYSSGSFTLAGALNFTGSDPAAIEFLTNKLKLNSNLVQKGNDAEVKLDGIDMKQASNTFTVSGVTYTLNGLTNNGAAGNAASVVITSDIEKTVENVKKFVESYNTMLKKLNDEVSEAKYKDYLPLTDEEKTSLTDEQIKAWEEKAKSGLLKQDSTLSTLITKMRNNFSDAVIGISGSYLTASSIGIDTSLGSYSDGGKLYVDENRLRSALNADPNAAYKVLGTDGTLLTGNQKGVLPRLYDSLKSSMDRIVTEGGLTASATYDTKSNLGKAIKDYTTQMTNMERIMEDAEDRYYKQYTAMETALNKMNQQSSWIAQWGK